MKCRISSLALAKMSRHAASGGSIEIMGMLTGSASMSEFTVTDCFALPVEASETRVNAMGEAYEYIVRYTSATNAKVIGWYHSHPGYGCFLSAIDVNTQEQNQAFQDPFVALVIDPVRTLETGHVEIGAFRTADGTFYELQIEYFQHKNDLNLLTPLDRRTWARTITHS